MSVHYKYFSKTYPVLAQIIASLLLLFSCSDTAPKIEKKPNIILINVDDLGWRDVGYNGSQYYETPNLDTLSRDGMVFTNGYAAATNSAPSRACLMTGNWTPRHGIYTVHSSNRGASKHKRLIPSKSTRFLEDKHITIPELFQMNGYATCHAGKWHITKKPEDQGFDLNIGGGSNAFPTSYYPPYKNVKLEAPNEEYLTDLIMAKTIEFVDTTRQPFLVYYAPYAVHTPLHPVDSLLPKYKGKKSWNGQGNPRYGTMIENLDRNIGLLLSALKEKNYLDHSLIVFTSDNGGFYGVTSQKPLRGGKGTYFEGGIRVPFLFSWKNRIKASTSNHTPITQLDIFPTLLEVAGITAPEDKQFDGHSILPLLLGNKKELEDRPLFWHFPIYLQAFKRKHKENRDSLFRTRPGSVVRQGKWKLHHYFEFDEMELFNLSDDIGERNNLADTNSEKAKELRQLLDTWREETQAAIPTKLNPSYERPPDK